MGWLFVPGLVDSSLESNWPSEMPTGLSVAWNGKALQPQSWSRVSKIAAFRRFLSGLTFDPSTADAGVESWISSLRDSRASRSQSPAFAVEPKIPGTSGRMSHGSSESASPPSSSLKTFRGCSQLGLPMGDMPTSTSSPIYEDWVTKLRLASSRRRRSARHISANGSSSWPTAQAHDSQKRGNTEADHHHYPHDLSNASEMWPTPNTPTGGPNTKSTATHTGGMDLDGAASLWQTPASDSFRSRGGERKDEMGLDQQARAETWATPAARSVKGGYSEQALTRADGKGRMDILDNQAIYFRPSPQALQTANDGQPSSGSAPTSRRQLNPAFVEWLMGWPTGWTSLAPLDCGSREMAWSHWPQRMRSELSRLGWGTPDDNC